MMRNLVILLALSVSACTVSELQVGDYDLVCAGERDCPDDYRCGADGKCHPPVAEGEGEGSAEGEGEGSAEGEGEGPAEGEGEGPAEGEGEGPAEGEGEGEGPAEGEGEGEGPAEGEGEGEPACGVCPEWAPCNPSSGECTVEDACDALCDAMEQHCEMGPGMGDCRHDCGMAPVPMPADVDFLGCLIGRMTEQPPQCDPGMGNPPCLLASCEGACAEVRGTPCDGRGYDECVDFCSLNWGSAETVACVVREARINNCDAAGWHHCGWMGPGPVQAPGCEELCGRILPNCNAENLESCRAACELMAVDPDTRECVRMRLDGGDRTCPPALFEDCKAPGCDEICRRFDLHTCGTAIEQCRADCDRLLFDPVRRRCAWDEIEGGAGPCHPPVFEGCAAGPGPGPGCPPGEMDLDPGLRPCETLVMPSNGVHAWGYLASTGGDWTGDGKADVLVGAGLDGQEGGRGGVWVLRGTDGLQVAMWEGPDNGDPLIAGGWLPSGDGVLVGRPMRAMAVPERLGRVDVMMSQGEPPFGGLLGDPGEHLGRFAVAGGDPDGDGLPSIWALGTSDGTFWNLVAVFEVEAGGARRIPNPLVLGLGADLSERCFEVREDFTGDGVPDLLTGGGDQLYVASGVSDGNGPPPLHGTVSSWGAWADDARACTPIPDVSGDQVPDILVAGFARNAPGPCAVQETVILSGASPGDIVRCLGPGGDHSTSVALGPDLDGDGKPEVLIGLGNRVEAWTLADNAANPLRTWMSPDGRRIDVAAGGRGDVDGDGQPDPLLQLHDQGWGNTELLVVRTGLAR